MAAREIAVSALGTVYALSASGDDLSVALSSLLSSSWSLPTALSLLAWFVFAPQCFATLGVIKRETNSWWVMIFAAAYLFCLAYLASNTRLTILPDFSWVREYAESDCHMYHHFIGLYPLPVRGFLCAKIPYPQQPLQTVHMDECGRTGKKNDPDQLKNNLPDCCGCSKCPPQKENVHPIRIVKKTDMDK